MASETLSSRIPSGRHPRTAHQESSQPIETMIPKLLIPAVLLAYAPAALAATYYWTDWQTDVGNGVYTGQMITPTSSVDVTYTNIHGIAFFQSGTGTDYFAQGGGGSLGRDPSSSPYTSSVVDNIPTAAEMIALRYSGTQTLLFSEAVANPVFSYVSLNSNGYAFNQDFEILSFGNAASPNNNDIGYFGNGTSYKTVVDLGGGNFEYQLNGTGEPHGTIRFLGSFDSLTWKSSSDEYWNGFTVGVQGTSNEVFPTPDGGATLVLLGLGLTGMATVNRLVRKKNSNA